MAVLNVSVVEVFYDGNFKLLYKIIYTVIYGAVKVIDNWAVCDCTCSTLKFTEKNISTFNSRIFQFCFRNGMILSASL